MQIYTSYSDGRLTLYLQGELDHHEAREAMKTIDKSIDEYMPRECSVDLSRLSFMDSSGIALLLKVYRRLKDMGGRACIENASEQPLKVIDAAGIERIIKISVAKE
jgi:stage II sporulation protein AA (anti-sigma F factor antagonist)